MNEQICSDEDAKGTCGIHWSAICLCNRDHKLLLKEGMHLNMHTYHPQERSSKNANHT